MRSIELFTGAGGLALGLHRAGFHHEIVVEIDRHACDTLRRNRCRQAITGVDWTIQQGDVRDFDFSAFLTGIDLLAGGAPCQPFSLGGKHAGDEDSRNQFPEVFRAVRELQPRAFLLENVRGLTRQSFIPYFEYIIDQLRFPHLVLVPGENWEEHKGRLARYAASIQTANGPLPPQAAARCYDVSYRVLDVADFGVPQRRQRVFIIGFRSDLRVRWAFPEPTHSEQALLYAQYVDGSYWVEHGLKRRSVPDRLAKQVAKLAVKPPPTAHRWITVRDAISDLPTPIMHDQSPPLDNHIGIPDARSYKGHTGSPWDWPAKTIKAGDHGNPGGENMLSDDDDSVRYFTVRELARLQTFPDYWHFAGTWGESRRQLGNAVPVKMAELLARRILDALATSGQAPAPVSPNVLVASEP